MRSIRLALIILALALPVAGYSKSVTVAAASSLQFVLRELATEYERLTTMTAPKLVFGSSGNLYRQIVQGAPFELFFSARSELVARLNKAGLSEDEGKRFGTGRLVLLYGSGVPSVTDFTDTVKNGVIQQKTKLAIANPTHAPYGRAAQQALQSIEMWDAVRELIVNGEQVSQAAQFVVNGSVPYGLVSLTLALAPRVAASSNFYMIDDNLHEPIALQMVLIDEKNSAARNFYQFVLENPAADEIFERYGLR